MKTVLLNGKTKEDAGFERLERLIEDTITKRNFELNSIVLMDKKIAPCQGRFDCWIKTPGVCRTNDFGREVAKEIAQSDLVLLLTPITFGGFSSELKKAMDRTIPNLLPFFKKINGEIHHYQRYQQIPSKIAIGYLEKPSEAQEKTFKELVHRNSLNMAGEVNECLIYVNGRDLEEFGEEFNNTLKLCEGVL